MLRPALLLRYLLAALGALLGAGAIMVLGADLVTLLESGQIAARSLAALLGAAGLEDLAALGGQPLQWPAAAWLLALGAAIFGLSRLIGRPQPRHYFGLKR